MTDKTWGPFNGRQLATMFVAAMAVAGSGTVWAVAPSAVNPFSYIAIQDPVSGNKAAVDVSRRLQVSDALQAVSANPAISFNAEKSSFGDCVALFTVPANRAVVVGSLILNAFDVRASGPGNFIQVGHGATCGNGPAFARYNPSAVDARDFVFNPGIAIPAGEIIWLNISPTISGDAYVNGYFVPAAWVPAPTASRSAGSQSTQKPNG
jgi:hypothetical protein